VFLDVGETMIRFTPPGATYRTILARYGCDVPAETLDATVRELFQELDRVVPRQLNPDHTISPALALERRTRMISGLVARAGVAAELAQEAADAIYASWIGTDLFRLYPDVLPTLEALRAAGYRLGIISNWEARLPQLCDSQGIGHYFEFVVCSEAEGYVKPHRRLFERALELAGVDPEAAVHVGDSYPEDVEGAQAVGIQAILVDRPGHRRVPYRPIIQSLAELPAVLEGL
jgi:REG-2-like HAD superfamily hydrolase